LFGAEKMDFISGGKVVPMWDMVRIIAKDINAAGKFEGNAISEIFPLLRTMQITLNWATPDKLQDDNG